MPPFVQGLILGFAISVQLGPALFTLLQTSIHRGLKSGLFLAGGIFLSDLSIVILAYLGALQVINQKNNYLIAGIIGGFILILFGLFTFLRKVHIDENNNVVELKVPGPITYILKGYFLNVMNPFVWFFWITAMVVSANFGEDKHAVVLFFIGTMGAIVSSDMFKVFIADKLKRYLKPQLLIRVNHIVGILLMISGVYLLIRVFLRF